ncbi:MAG: hypothetical protein A3E31_17395 [Candidatus Rokubacteria bacterium RIFCSPHIGHO2_12_FULL_73_22]|nr:MAG: hypothetical protein A3D33_21655 [Candidatus Rokubacteria bacterium RIFCSPHIGHO2_02_FULL_73_26]OGK99611.1 MAG: hypothetical protein A3E31_17395 [Candidatus Rokubacteria bacterium RIFCSPHIGHO2_12_FULL_73_22]OGL08328.1 MAG: hypothetical protein A3I14_15965 [Candidatus Rokubacteria bacterium RIFCSPLOWO2_02_FULL_73_56]OGL30093.1 MAG: hypothetical protein A3G44_00375 [Candidatus Rokubacteria bacterium RIFCSPLOWO2_12_FULL_73_47]
MPRKKRRTARRPAPRRRSSLEDRGEVIELAREVVGHTETSPALSGGDLDADWQSASSTGEEAVGGSVATPDQDVVDELGRALGVEQEADAQVHTSDELLKQRDRFYWHLERDAADAEEGRPRRRRA